MGSVVTVAAPRPVIEALTEVQVQSESGSQSGFQLQFTLGKDAPLQLALLAGLFDPTVRVIIVVTVNGTSHVLMDGIITRQDVAPGQRAGQSVLTVTGLDLTAMMDLRGPDRRAAAARRAGARDRCPAAVEVRSARHRAEGDPQRAGVHQEPAGAASCPARHGPEIHRRTWPVRSAMSSTWSPAPSLG